MERPVPRSDAEMAALYQELCRLQLGRIAALERECGRLRRGEFTPKEFQDLCHHRDERPGCSPQDFAQGCREYQGLLFGAPVEPKHGRCCQCD